MNDISLAGMHSVRSTGAMAYSQAASAPRPLPSVQSEPEQLDQVNIGSHSAVEIEPMALESVALETSSPAPAEPSLEKVELGEPQVPTYEEFDGFLIASAPPSKSNALESTQGISVSSLGTIALLEEAPAESQLESTQALESISDRLEGNELFGIGMVMNGPSSAAQGLYNLEGQRLA